MSPLDNEADLGADEHNAFLVETLGVFGKTLANVVMLIGDNCRVDQAMSRRLDIPLVGCASQKFNLAVRKFLAVYKQPLQLVNSIVLRSRTLLNRALLRRLRTWRC